MPRDDDVTVTERDVEEFARIIRGLREEVQHLKEERQSQSTIQLIRSVSETAVASDSITVTEDTSPTLVFDSDSFDYAEFGE